jgi:hypothetical protein
MQCHNKVQKHLDGSLATHTIANRLVLRKHHTLMYSFQNGVLPLLLDFSYLSSDICKVCNDSLIFNIPWMMKRKLHLHLAHCGDCFAPSQDLSMPIP